jgi:parallel beta-helix repeat protein
MNRLLLLLAISMCIGDVAVAQGDLGAQIAAADAKLGANPGRIIVSTSGTISEGEVSLSAGHDLVCTNQATIFLDAGSYLYQSSNTSIKNCIISSTSTPINGEVQSLNTTRVQLDGVTFVGGGNLVYWVGVTDFVISNNTVTSITAADPVTEVAQNGYYLKNCSRGWVNDLVVNSFVFPPGQQSYPAIVGLFDSSEITINNISINNVDASFDFGGSGIQINGSSQITIKGGMITNNAKIDGVTAESWGTSPSSDITITGLNASYDGQQGLNTAAPLTLGDGLDIINSRHVRISNCTILGTGYIGNRQAGIWLFLDDDVVVSNCNISEGSAGGIDICGSPDVQLINNTLNDNQDDGTFTEAQIGTGTSVGSTVTWFYGVTGGFSLAWPPGTPFLFDGHTYSIVSVTDNLHIVITPTPPNHAMPAAWEVDSVNEKILGGVINDNARSLRGSQTQVGIDWVDSTTGIIAGVTSINTGIGSQLYGLELDNQATALLENDNFSENLRGGNGIYAGLQNASPTSLSFPNQAVATTSPALTVTLNAGAVAVSNLLVQVSGDFSETNNCGTQLRGYKLCQIHVTFTPTVAGARSGTLTMTADAPNATQTISLSGTGVLHGLGLTIANGGSGSATVSPGVTAKYLLSIGGAGVSGTAALSCTVAPPSATCDVPSREALSATQATTFTVSVTPPAYTGALRTINHRLSPWILALSIMGWVFLPGVTNKRAGLRSRQCVLLWLMMFVCSCGGGSVAPMKGYTLTVSANAGGASQQVPLTLLVQ